MLTWSKCSLLFLLFIFFFDFSNISISSGFRLLRDDPTSWQQVKCFGPLTGLLPEVPWSLLWWSDHQCSSSLETHTLTWCPDQVLVPRQWHWPSRKSVCPAGQSNRVWRCYPSQNPQSGQRSQMTSVHCFEYSTALDWQCSWQCLQWLDPPQSDSDSGTLPRPCWWLSLHQQRGLPRPCRHYSPKHRSSIPFFHFVASSLIFFPHQEQQCPSTEH